MKWKVETIFGDRWDDADWTGDDKPLRFDTEEQANEEIDKFIQETMDAFSRGDLDEPYDRHDYRAVPCEPWVRAPEDTRTGKLERVAAELVNWINTNDTAELCSDDALDAMRELATGMLKILELPNEQ